MLLCERHNGDTIPNACETGDLCYIDGSGAGGTSVKNFSAGRLFGELAMFYNAPRTATIASSSPKVSPRVFRGLLSLRASERLKERTLTQAVSLAITHDILSGRTLEKFTLASPLADTRAGHHAHR